MGRVPWERGAATPIQVPLESHAQLLVELTGLLRQQCPTRGQRHLTQLSWMVAGLLLSET